jgi:hypothetical protein
MTVERTVDITGGAVVKGVDEEGEGVDDDVISGAEVLMTDDEERILLVKEEVCAVAEDEMLLAGSLEDADGDGRTEEVGEETAVVLVAFKFDMMNRRSNLSRLVLGCLFIAELASEDPWFIPVDGQGAEEYLQKMKFLEMKVTTWSRIAQDRGQC